jgi:hypothetical protein
MDKLPAIVPDTTTTPTALPTTTSTANPTRPTLRAARPKPFQFHQGTDPNAPTIALSTESDNFVTAVVKDVDFQGLVTKWRNNEGATAKQVILEHHSGDSNNNRQVVEQQQQGFNVFARVRPILPESMDESAEKPNWETLTCMSPYLFQHTAELRMGLPTGRMLSTPQRFTQTFGPSTTETRVFEQACLPLINGAIDEHDKCLIIAFGQTGSGKTHTMKSAMESTLKHLYVRLNQQKTEQSTTNTATNTATTVSVQYFEIRGTKVLDLLSDRKECTLRTDGDGNVHVVGVASVTCSTLTETSETLAKGVALRCTRATHSNAQSSRSHAIAVFELSSGGRIQMIDLAGSEKGKDAATHTSELISELQEINWSLGTLKACIRSMYLKEVHGKNHEHVNYRNSKLTLLLRDMFSNHDVEEEVGETVGETVGGVGGKETTGETKTEPPQEKDKTVTAVAETTSPSRRRRKRPRTSFIACFAPLDKHQLHTIGNAKYCRQLRAVGSVRDGSRTATFEELKEGLMLYYLDCCPEKATSDAVEKLLKSFAGREKKLHGGYHTFFDDTLFFSLFFWRDFSLM